MFTTYLRLFGASFCWACNSVLARLAVGEVSPLLIVSLRWFGAVVLILTFAGNAISRDWPTPKGWGIVVFITVLPSFFAQIWFIRGVSDIGAGRAGIFVNLVPVFAAILAVSILHEPFQWYHGAALTLVLVGIGLSERHRKDTA